MYHTNMQFENVNRYIAMLNGSEMVYSILLSWFIKKNAPNPEMTIKDSVSFLEGMNFLEGEIREIADRIDSRMAIPILMECYAMSYYDKNWEAFRDYGLAFKSSVAHFDNCQLTSKPLSQEDYLNISELVISCYMYNKIASIGDLFKLFTDEIEITVTPYGLEMNPYARYHVDQYHLAYNKKGMGLRTKPFTDLIIRGGMYLALKDCVSIISGVKPENIPSYRGTIFSEIDGGSNFWLGIACRLLAYFGSLNNSINTDKTIYTLIVNENILESIEKFMITRMHLNNRETNKRILDYVDERIIWNRDWQQNRRKSSPHSMIIEKPVVFICDAHPIYFTSLASVPESISSYVESSILNYPDWNGDKMNERLFLRHVSKPFEARVIEKFRSMGFTAGVVDKRGVWKNSQGNERLTNESAVFPGEIDLLAVNKDKKIIIVGECKVIALPEPGARMKNVVNKIGKADSKKIHDKLMKKMHWIRTSSDISSLDDYKFFHYIILDSPLPAMINKEEPSSKLSELSPIIYEEIIEDTIRLL